MIGKFVTNRTDGSRLRENRHFQGQNATFGPPTIVVDRRMVVINHPMALVDRPTVVINRPIALVDRPMVVIHRPMALVDRLMVVVNCPIVVINRLTALVDRPMVLDCPRLAGYPRNEVTGGLNMTRGWVLSCCFIVTCLSHVSAAIPAPPERTISSGEAATAAVENLETAGATSGVEAPRASDPGVSQGSIAWHEARDWTTVGAAVLAALFAGRGLFTWRDQLIAQRNHDHARKLLLALLESRDALLDARRPVSQPGEVSAVERDLIANGVQKGDTNWEYFFQLGLFNKRTEPLNRPGAALIDLIREAEVLWGPSAAKRFETLAALYNEFKVESMICIDEMRNPMKERDAKYRIGGDSYQIFKAPWPEDKFGQRVRDEVESIRAHFARYVNARR